MMLAKWTEILPLFVVRWLALQACERMFFIRGDKEQIVATARPDVLIRVPERPVERDTQTKEQA